ncbi:hypothetical protein [Nitrosovibrio sp. Nv4]|uniref:hypothetical protein n=1 Tax=Nitrosovibrio sp. Nv4 TaxID=1945880 RepID=UPI000BC564DE|nr:hypothetical protein [Nitrosovibrio sp. Nv4]SOD41712.1 hypothetical protein SAMN06298226_2014 [Nitrosovibrio sp. Nv4]
MCSSKPPRPDPLIGQAAKQQADIGQQQLDVAKQQLEWEKDRAGVQDPLIQRVVDQQIASGDANAARAESQWQVYRNLFAPIEERLVKDANDFDSTERKERMAAEAVGDVARGYQGALASNQRAMARMGVNPNSGRFQALNHEINLGLAKDTAGAMNKARRDTELQGMAMRQSAAQFGRNMPSTGIATDAAALSAGNAATDNLATKAGLHNAGMNAAQSWFDGAIGANTAAGNMMLNQYQGQLGAWQQQQQNRAEALSGLGSLVGTLGGAYMKGPGLRKGGVIKNYSVYGFKSGGYNGGLSTLKRKGYTEGGMIEGPGTGTSDSISATIEGVEPIRLSNGEAVLNQEAVALVGEDFIHRINSGSLAMSQFKDTENKEIEHG